MTTPETEKLLRLPEEKRMTQELGRSIMTETMKNKLTFNEVAPEGLGYGDGSISYRAREQEVGPENIRIAREIIQSDRILVPVDRDSDGNILQDDGCGDGRSVTRVFKGIKEVTKKSLNRAKVFGAGLAMGLAGRIGVQGLTASTLTDEFAATMDELDERGLDYGGHSDNHAHGPNCGCGAIDKANIIIATAIKYETEIRDSLNALGSSDNGLAGIFTNFEGAAVKIADQPYAGRSVWDKLRGRGKVNKELADDHFEMFVVLNKVRGMTVNQEIIRQATGGLVQVFAVDLWRIEDIAKSQFPDDEKDAHVAELSQQVYTLGTAATLTAGDLPVFVIDGPALAA